MKITEPTVVLDGNDIDMSEYGRRHVGPELMRSWNGDLRRRP